MISAANNSTERSAAQHPHPDDGEDRRPAGECTAAGRYLEPSLFTLLGQ
jgi:hypothetical protein